MSDPWTCIECEYENEPTDVACASCDIPRPLETANSDDRYAGFKVGLIESVEEIPKTKLRQVVVDLGSGEKVTIVTNAANIKTSGVRVVVATIGATVLMGGEEIKVTKATVGGRKSEAVLCDSMMLGWKGGAAGVAVTLPDSFALGAAPPATKPRSDGH
ncbi:hypothetical protein HK101_008902 [Irineochytrium annulatum]|nr:hypothetical protein HK101_008902 [Irineochytrium annulatum]